MGQYFNWVNLDKNEIIETWAWPNGQKLVESTYYGCEETDAALTMMAGDWAGDLVVFMGDYATFEDETHPKRKEVEQMLAGIGADDYLIDFIDIIGRFDYAKEHPEIKHPVYSENCNDTWGSYTGPFDLKIERFRFVINESKKEFVDRERTAVRYINPSTGEIVRYDLVPEMMSSETRGLKDPEHEVAGLWFGDCIRPSQEHPGAGYREIGRNYSFWAPPIVNCPDEEIAAVIAEHSLNLEDKDILDQIHALLSSSSKEPPRDDGIH